MRVCQRRFDALWACLITIDMGKNKGTKLRADPAIAVPPGAAAAVTLLMLVIGALSVGTSGLLWSAAEGRTNL